MNTPGFTIAAVERDTGLSKDVLRMWERRYGFPVPARDSHGERLYSIEQLERLRLIKRLMDQGHRPGKLICESLENLATLGPKHPLRELEVPLTDAAGLEELMALIKQHDTSAYLQAMQQRLARQGLQIFVQDTVAPLTERVGLAWESGRFAVFEEHLFTELTKRVLRQAIATLPPVARRPRVILTSVPDEAHSLGLLMVESLFALEGVDCVPLGTQTPLTDIVRAAEAHQADIVGLSFSIAFPFRQIGGIVQQLRKHLPQHTALWIGGAGSQRLGPIDGVQILPSLAEAFTALHAWREAASTPPA